MSIALKQDFFEAIQRKFSDMIDRYRGRKPHERFTKFFSDYLESQGCSARIKLS